MSDSASVSDTDGQLMLSEYLERSDLQHFIQQVTAPDANKQFISFTFPVPRFDPLACLEILSESTSEFNFYWEKPDQELALSAGGELETIRDEGGDRFRDIARRVAQIEQSSASFTLCNHSLSGIHFLGGFSFFDNVKSRWWKPFGSGSLTVPRWQLIREGKLGLLTINMKLDDGEDQAAASKKLASQLHRFEQLFRLNMKPPPFTSNTINLEEHTVPADQPEAEWTKIVEEAKELINNNAFDKIVLAREVVRTTRQPISPTQVLNTLRGQYPACYNFLIQNSEGKSFLGCSPERLVSFQKNYLLTDSLAGSVSRGKTATEDIHLEKFLLNSSKNRSEHQFVTDAIEKHLAPFIRKIERADQPDVKKLKNVQHLHTPVRAWLKQDTDRYSILEKLHPTPAVGGHPRDRAVPYISKLENFDRGWYAGPVGWFNLNGGGEFAVAIRSSLVDGNKARLFAGCGIVKDSDPRTEWEETNLKLMPILAALESNGDRQAE
ncbi:isochorismate synthase MenF [Halalkalibaculum sp. DA3122]|uniref:isochorismate synthase n=1 Tax=unclassified Halalkalibaculum TaxID=2964617 RepID=UPI0037544B2F